MNILVTGGAGFIGSHLVNALLAAGHDVRIVDNLSTGKRANLSSVANDVELIQGDIRNEDVARKSVADRELIFHQAALPSVPRSVKDPKNSVDNNVLGTVVLLKAAVDAGVRRVIYAGSSSAYGNCAEDPKVETIVPRVLSPYAASKLAGESLLQAFSSCYGLETIVTRYFNVFGKRQNPFLEYSAVIPRWCGLLINGKQPTIFGDGETTRDFCFIKNAVQANILAAKAKPFNLKNRIVNVAYGESISLNDLLDILKDCFDAQHIETIYAPFRQGDIRDALADISRAKEIIGYSPIYDVREGVKQYTDWYKQAKDWVPDHQPEVKI